MGTAQDVIAACEAQWGTYKGDCSGFAKAVGNQLGVTLTGQANDIVDQIQQAPWTTVAGGPAAAQEAANGKFVVAGLKGTAQQLPDPNNGHVVVVVAGDLARGLYPTAYWGKLNSVGCKATTLNWAWAAIDRDNVIYGVTDWPAAGE